MEQTVQAQCRGCGQSFKVSEKLVGRRVKCPGCGDPVAVSKPGSASAKAEAPAPASDAPAPAFPDFSRPSPPPPPAPPRHAPAEPQGGAFNFEDSSGPSRRSASDRDEDDYREELSPSARRKKKAQPRRWATVGAMFGAITAAALVAWLQPTDEAIILYLIRTMPEAPIDKMRGAVVGAIHAAAAGAFLLAVVGRTIGTWFAWLLLTTAGAIYGCFMPLELQDMAWTFLMLAAMAGILCGGLGGFLFGLILSAASKR